jgi:indole-3-glycerol phosphate synthase
VNKIQSHENVAEPFVSLFLIDIPLLHIQCTKKYICVCHPFNPSLGLIPKKPRREKIRIAYFSADFGRHAVSALAAELFELHDKNKFEIIAFSFAIDDKSMMHSRLNQAFDQFIVVNTLSDEELARFFDLATHIGLDVLVETHDEKELERSLNIGASIIGVNQRDLITFEVDHARAERMASLIPPTVVRVAESGVRDANDARRLRDAGYDAVLVGESIVTASDPIAAVRDLMVV